MEAGPTYGWLVHRLKAGEPEFLGLYPTRARAEADIGALGGTAMEGGWKVERIRFFGLGRRTPGKPPLKGSISERDL
jgi:hypothetical protein